MTAVTSIPPPQVPSIPLSPELPVNHQDQSIGSLVREASIHLSTLVRSEVELAKAEVVSEVRKGVKGSIFFAVALTIALFSFFFLFMALAEVLDAFVPRMSRWGAYSTVWGLMLLTAALFVLLGIRRVRSIRKPERTISSLQDAMHLARRNGAEHLADGHPTRDGHPTGRNGDGAGHPGG